MKLLTTILIGGLLTLLMVAGCEREITGNVPPTPDNNRDNCLECHSGYLDQAQGEWANSVHASGSSIDYTNRDGSDCMMCHDQQGFIEFLTTGDLPDIKYESVSAIGCFSCHNPHENGDLSLRTTAAYTLADGDVFNHGKGNLCVNCHHSRTDVRTITDNQRTTARAVLNSRARATVSRPHHTGWSWRMPASAATWGIRRFMMAMLSVDIRGTWRTKRPEPIWPRLVPMPVAMAAA